MYEKRPKTAAEYVKLVELALAELEEMRACHEYDMGSDGDALGFLEPIEAHLRKMRAGMADGSYYFENEDLPFMALANRFRNQIPFMDALATINLTHRQGLAIDGK